MGRYKKRLKYKGCNEDCENCPYPDCLKPARDMKPARDLGIGDVTNRGKEQQKMYTLELGKCGRERPNISRKFYR